MNDTPPQYSKVEAALIHVRATAPADSPSIVMVLFGYDGRGTYLTSTGNHGTLGEVDKTILEKAEAEVDYLPSLFWIRADGTFENSIPVYEDEEEEEVPEVAAVSNSRRWLNEYTREPFAVLSLVFAFLLFLHGKDGTLFFWIAILLHYFPSRWRR